MSKILKFPSITPKHDIPKEYSYFAPESAKDLMIRYNISLGLATELLYLRSRSRWTEELENRIVRCFHKTGSVNFHILQGEEGLMLNKLGF
jgi:hypothetical protein